MLNLHCKQLRVIPIELAFNSFSKSKSNSSNKCRKAFSADVRSSPNTGSSYLLILSSLLGIEIVLIMVIGGWCERDVGTHLYIVPRLVSPVLEIRTLLDHGECGESH